MRRFDLVIFDFDNTIGHLGVDWPSVKAVLLSIAANKGIEIKKNTHLAVLANNLSKKGLKKEVDEVFLTYETNCVDNKAYSIFREMPSFIKKLHSKGIKLAIASGNHTNTLVAILSKAGLLEDFDIVCGRDKVKNNKPDPDQLILIMKKLNTPKGHTVFVGDSCNDKAAAEAAGIQYVKIDPARLDDGMKTLRQLLLA